MSLSIGMKTPVSVLQEYLLRLGHVPQYDLVRDDTGTHIPTFTYRLEYDSHVVEGTGSSKKEAKQITARLMLEALTNSEPQQPLHIEPNEAVPIKKVSKYNSVGALTDFCANMKMAQGPQYFDVREEGPPHAKLFTVRCSVSQLSETAVSGTKKQAKQLAAQQMLTKLKSLQVIAEETANSAPSSFLVDEPKRAEKIDPELRKKVIDHFTALRSFSSQHVCGSSVASYHKVFKSDNFAIPEKTANLASRVKKSESVQWDLPYIQENYEELFKEITTEMGVEGTFSEIPDENFNQILLSVNHSPNVTFLGSGTSKESARKDAIVFYLHYLVVLIS